MKHNPKHKMIANKRRKGKRKNQLKVTPEYLEKYLLNAGYRKIERGEIFGRNRIK